MLRPLIKVCWTKFGRDGTTKDEVPTWALVTTENFIRCWDQKACELLHNVLKKGVIMLRNDTLCTCHGVLYTK
jgi:hypothetical protein